MDVILLLDRSGNVVPKDIIEQFSALVRGSLILSDDERYEDARHIWNAVIDKRPGAILRCRGTADVVVAVNFARDNNVLVAVRGGGHNVGGRALCDDGLVIDLSEMHSVYIDSKAQTARVQGGATLGDVDQQTHLHGLAVPLGAVSMTGVGGLTTGGGVGWLARKYGLSCDNVLEAEVVTAEGKVLTVSSSENADLFWAIRGGGGNFGIVTSFLFQAYPVSTIVGGLIAYPREDAATVLRGYRDFVAKAPRELTVYAGLIWGPDGTPLTAIIPCWIGDQSKGEALIAPLKELGEPLVSDIQSMPFPAIQSMLDGAYPPGTRNYWKSSYLQDMTDQAIDTIVAQAKNMTSPASALLIEHCSGAGDDKPNNENAFAQRGANFLVAFMPLWTDPADDQAQIAWAKTAWDELEPHSSGVAYLNYISEGDEEAVQTSFGSNLTRLAELKQKYDPGNFFSLNQNILPAA